MDAQAFHGWCRTPSTPLVMGILNITPDSFSDGGQYLQREKALYRAEAMLAEGADILDIGAESTRPGAKPLGVQAELDRLMPMLEGLKQITDKLISIDTYKPEVMQAAVLHGAGLINDIYGLRAPGALAAAAALDVPIVIMHMNGEPSTMQSQLNPACDMVQTVHGFFESRLQAASKAQIDKQRLILDIGFGFGKTVQQNLMLIQQLHTFQTYGLPLLLGVSRKSTIGKVLKQPVDKRLVGGLALTVLGVQAGARIIRTHDVAQTKQALTMIEHVLHAHQLNKYEGKG